MNETSTDISEGIDLTPSELRALVERAKTKQTELNRELFELGEPPQVSNIFQVSHFIRRECFEGQPALGGKLSSRFFSSSLLLPPSSFLLLPLPPSHAFIIDAVTLVSTLQEPFQSLECLLLGFETYAIAISSLGRSKRLTHS